MKNFFLGVFCIIAILFVSFIVFCMSDIGGSDTNTTTSGYEMGDDGVSVNGSQKGSKKDEERITSLLNYINFSTSKIAQSNNIGILENEFNGVLNYIEPASLINDELIDQYGELLDTITNLQLTQNRRDLLKQEQEKQRKNAVYNCFNSFGSVYVPGSTPLSLASSLVYAAINAGFNYARTVNEIDSQTREGNFELDQEDLKDINSLRSSLFKTSARLLKNTGKTTKLIADGEMQSFSKIVAEIESASMGKDLVSVCSKYIPVLNNMSDTFSNFVPYLLTVGICCYEKGAYNDAKLYFDKVEKLSKNIYVLKHNPYLLSAAKYQINIALQSCGDSASDKKNAFSSIEKYINYIEQNTLKTAEAQDDLAYYLYSVYLGFDEIDKAEDRMSYLLKRKLEAAYGNMATVILSYSENGVFKKLAHAMDAYRNGFFFYEMDGKMYIYYNANLCSVISIFIDSEQVYAVNESSLDDGWRIREIKNTKYKNIRFSKFEYCKTVKVVLKPVSLDMTVTYDLYNVKKINADICHDLETENNVKRDIDNKYVTLVSALIGIQDEPYKYSPNTEEKNWNYYE